MFVTDLSPMLGGAPRARYPVTDLSPKLGGAPRARYPTLTWPTPGGAPSASSSWATPFLLGGSTKHQAHHLLSGLSPLLGERQPRSLLLTAHTPGQSNLQHPLGLGGVLRVQYRLGSSFLVVGTAPKLAPVTFPCRVRVRPLSDLSRVQCTASSAIVTRHDAASACVSTARAGPSRAALHHDRTSSRTHVDADWLSTISLLIDQTQYSQPPHNTL